MSIGVSVSMRTPPVGAVEAGASCEAATAAAAAGAARDRVREVDGLLTLCWLVAAGAGSGATAWEQEGLWVLSMAVLAGGVELEGRQRRLAALALSAVGTSGLLDGMANRARTLLGSS